MANNSGSIGCLVLVGIGGGAVYGVGCNHSSQRDHLPPHEQYTNIANLKGFPALTTFSGRQSIDKATNEVDDVF
jgi:hypothetical protein